MDASGGGRVGGRARPGLVLMAGLLIGLSGGEVQAQWGWGYGPFWGGGGGAMSNYATLNYLNQRSLTAANAAFAARSNGPFGNNVYANNPNSYLNHVRDNNNFFQRFDVSSRRTMDFQVTGGGGAASPTRARTTTPAAPAVPPLVSFFSQAGRLVWPADSPTEGDLGAKRTAADQSAGDVYREVQGRGFASVGLVTDARTRLVDYGRPALEHLHANASPAIADTFHRFLLSFYDALGQSAYGGTPGR